jgi:hypothetical protein
VKDLSGRGNHLVAAGRPGRQADALTWSTEHHPDQPTHSSLVLRGGRASGDYLKTVDGAALDTETFPHGYTFEAFFKLPADFDPGTDAWAAVLSRAGTSAEAGKAKVSGDPQEPVVTLSLSGGREPQWCVYPLSQDGSLTNWGHELPVDRWWHVAVINDGQHTTMYIDGCPVVRNPTTRNRGLGSGGRDWPLGGYDYNGVLDQVLKGSIGDVRVVNRALPPSQLMIAG